MSDTNKQSDHLIDILDVNLHASSKPTALLQTSQVKLLRLVLPAGKEIAEHKAPGEITVHCVRGHIRFTTMGQSTDMRSGQLMHLPASQPHGLVAIEDSVVLVHLILPTS